MDTGDQSIGQYVGCFRTSTAANECINRFVARLGPLGTKTLTQQGELTAPAQQVAAEKGHQAVRQRSQFAVQKEVAVVRSRFGSR